MPVGIDHLVDGDGHGDGIDAAAGENHELGHAALTLAEDVQADGQEAGISLGELADLGDIQRVGGDGGDGGVVQQDIASDDQDNRQDSQDGQAGAEDPFGAGGFGLGGLVGHEITPFAHH